MFIIEDAIHADWHGQFADFAAAIAELKRLSAIPWDEPPNCAPCTSWPTCGREYEIVQFDDSSSPWTELDRVAVLEISANGVTWAEGIEGIE